MMDRRAAATDSMAASRQHHFRDMHIFVYRFLKFLKALYNFNIQCKYRQIMKMTSNELTCFYINYMLLT